MSHFIKATFVLFLVTASLACGQKGPLRLPEKPSEEAPAPPAEQVEPK